MSLSNVGQGHILFQVWEEDLRSIEHDEALIVGQATRAAM